MEHKWSTPLCGGVSSCQDTDFRLSTARRTKLLHCWDKSSHILTQAVVKEKELRNCRRDDGLARKLGEYSLNFIPSDAVVQEITPPDDGLLRCTPEPRHRVFEINLPRGRESDCHYLAYPRFEIILNPQCFLAEKI